MFLHVCMGGVGVRVHTWLLAEYFMNPLDKFYRNFLEVIIESAIDYLLKFINFKMATTAKEKQKKS